MGSSRTVGFAAGVAIRAAAIGALVFAALWLMVWRQYYATGAILIGVGALIALDIARSAQAIDRTMAQFVDGLFAEGFERPVVRPAGGRLAVSVERALARLGETRADRQRRLEYFQALIDTVAAAVLVVGDEGAVEFANLAARRRLGEAARLDQFAPLAGGAADQLLQAPLGSRRIVILADGQRTLASVGGFSSAAGQRRLIALQSVSGDLDAVELEAWQGLTRILAHEMMNSLTPICSLAEGLPALLPAELAGSAPISEAIEVIARRSAGLMSFVERYRRLADLPAPARSPIAAAALIAGLKTLMAPLMAERRALYESLAEPPDLALSADPDLLEQAVINLLKNALDAVGGRAGGLIQLSCRREGDGVVISVRDNGPGLSPAAAEEAFTPFFTTKPGGSGIGLSLARQIALAHGGRLEHRPASPHGAEFRLVLPDG
jgi:nitrogen fixation/metabolism regulation signal transduction histidine kinase